MKVLIIGNDEHDRHNWGHQLFKDEIGRQCEATYYGAGYPGFAGKKADLYKVLGDCTEYDVIITYIMKRLINWVRGLEKIHIPKVHIVVDYVPLKDWDKMHDAVFDKNKHALIFARTGFELRHLRKRRKEPAEYLPYSVDTNTYTEGKRQRVIDISAIWNRGSGYPNRTNAKNMLTQLPTNKTFAAKVYHQEYVAKLQESKISLNSINGLGTLNQRFTEIMACGAMLLTDVPKEAEGQGFVPKKHFVPYTRVNEAKELIGYYLNHPEERAAIAKAGHDFVVENHSNEVRVKKMLKKIEGVL